MHSCWHTSRILALVIACIAIGDVAHAQRGRGSRRTTPAPTTEEQVPISPPVEANPYGDDQPPPTPPARLGTTQTMPSAPPAETRPTSPARTTATTPVTPPARTTATTPVAPPARVTAAATPPAPVTEDASGLDASSDDSETPDSEADDDGRPPRVKFHAAGVGVHATMFQTEAEYGYSLIGPAVSYTYFIGRTWGFAIHGSLYFPMHGRYAGGIIDDRGSLIGPYDLRRVGLDGMVLVATRRELSDSLVLMLGVGLHAQSYKLSGSNSITIDDISGGIGILARLDYRVSDLVSIGAYVSSGVDPLDFVRHSNRAVITATVTAGLSVGLTFD